MRKENIAAMRYGMPTQTTTGPNAYRVIRGTSQISVRNHPGNNLDDRHQNNRNEPLRFDSLYNQKFGAGRLWQPEPKASGLQLYSKDRLTADRLQNKEEKPNSQTLSRLERVNKQISTPAIQTEQSETTKQSKTMGLVGLNNIGNTCFMNATLQCLFNLPNFNDYFTSGKYKQDLKPSGRVAQSYARLVTLIKSTSSRYETPSVLKSSLSERRSQFAGYSQQDAQQLLSNLLECIGQDVSRVNKKSVPYRQLSADTKKHSLQQISDEWWKYYKDRENSIVFDFFSGQLMSKVICSKCNKESIAFDIFNDLQLSFSKGQTELDKLIEQFLREETLTDDYFCSGCKQLRQSKRKLSLFRLPRVLVLQLKRFAYGKWKKEKINTRVGFPHVLDLARHVTESKDPSTSSAIYELVGVVNHSGGIDFGHYTADCKVNGKWYTFNDSHVSPNSQMEKGHHDSSNPYLLFYFKK